MVREISGLALLTGGLAAGVDSEVGESREEVLLEGRVFSPSSSSSAFVTVAAGVGVPLAPPEPAPPPPTAPAGTGTGFRLGIPTTGSTGFLVVTGVIFNGCTFTPPPPPPDSPPPSARNLALNDPLDPVANTLSSSLTLWCTVGASKYSCNISTLDNLCA